MRKFVIKNRQKRKYTRKVEETPSFSFSKTAYGMMPLLVMLIAFMSTMVISTPFRDAVSSIKFSFQLPDISLSNPLTSLQSFAGDITQLGAILWTITTEMYGSLMQFVTLVVNAVAREVFVIQTNLILLGDMMDKATVFITHFISQEISGDFNFLGQMIVAIGFYIELFTKTIASAITNLLIIIWQSIAITTQSIANAVSTFAGTLSYISIVIARFVAFISLATLQFILFVLETIWSTIGSITIFITTVIAHIIAAIVHTIEIPFKILYAFWLEIKPYVDFFGKHVRMTGDDLSNGFTSIGKVSSLMGVSK